MALPAPNLPYFSSVPGMAVPGMAQPGRAQRFSYPLYLYEGHAACFYLDYLDVVTGHTLSPVPGGYYSMTAVSGRAGLTVPPPGRPWSSGNPGAGGTFAPLFRRPARFIPAEISHGHYPGAACGHCDPSVRDHLPPPRRTDGPDVAPGEDYATVMARCRAHAAALHAARARGVLRPGEPLSGEDHQRLGCCPGGRRED